MEAITDAVKAFYNTHFGVNPESVDAKVAEVTQADEAAKVQAAADLESKKQSLQDQIKNLTEELTALDAPQG